MWRSVAAAATLFVAACGGAGTTATPSSTPTAIATARATTTATAKATQPVITPTATAEPTPLGTLATCMPIRGGTSESARITDMRIATAPSYDTLVVQFDTTVPQYELTLNPSGVQFTGGGGKGGSFTLAGTYGVGLTIYNLSWTVSPGNQYPHGTDLAQSAPTLVEVRQIGDFEGIANIALGLSSDVCPSISTLADPPRLQMQFASG